MGRDSPVYGCSVITRSLSHAAPHVAPYQALSDLMADTGDSNSMTIQEFFQKNRIGHHKPWEAGKFSAKDAYPDLSKHNNVMATHMTLPIYEQLWDKVTPNGVTFDKCIQTGVD